jgi:oxygen-independent coproporphyrinogen-3 oxidase
MFAIPGQTLEVWKSTLDEVIALGSEHLSCYEVIYEEDTPLFAQLAAGKITPDEDLACAMYDTLVERANAAGFVQYEIANFARRQGGEEAADLPVRVCHHNVNYWRGGSYYGLGPSAAGYVRGARTKNWSNTQLYCERLERGERAIETVEELAPLKRAGETAAFGLRMNAGWPLADFRAVTGLDLGSEWQAEIADLLLRGWGDLTADRFRLTPAGLRFADTAAEMFLR